MLGAAKQGKPVGFAGRVSCGGAAGRQQRCKLSGRKGEVQEAVRRSVGYRCEGGHGDGEELC